MENITTWDNYLKNMSQLLQAESPTPPYDDPDYFNYLKLNDSRQRRWLKIGVLEDDLTELLRSINQEQRWYLITEPWCGDASQIAPFIFKMSEINPKIKLKIVYRDTPPLMIDDYLTNGGKSIPKLVVRNDKEEDLFVWGPRPKECQKLFMSLKEKGADLEAQKIELQKWYNQDKGKSLQKEFLEGLSGVI